MGNADYCLAPFLVSKELDLINQELQTSKSRPWMACSLFIFFIGVYCTTIVKTIIVEGAGLCPLQS